jgi:hypothetical protein
MLRVSGTPRPGRPRKKEETAAAAASGNIKMPEKRAKEKAPKVLCI